MTTPRYHASTFGFGTRLLTCMAGVTLCASSSFAQVSVTATAGDMGPTAYATVKAAFDAINAGTPQGAITVDIGANTTEGATPAVLNSSGAGSATYTSVLIRPSADGVIVAGSPPTGRGVIELNGADNVTIDGDNPGSAGINRNLTIQNTVAATTTYGSVIRIAMAATIVTSADNNTIKNLNLLGHATGRNISTATSTTGSENTTYGILATGGASTVSATTAPTAISSVSTTIGTGATATNLTIQNNSITTAARAIAVQGSATTVFPGLLIENNVIGNATAGATDQVYSMGVTAQGSTTAIIRGNTVYVESYVGTQVRGLEFGSISATGTGALFDKNQVLRVRNSNPGTFGAYGINLGGGNTHTVQNNFVADVKNDQTAGTGAFSTTFGALGIRVASGTGHKVYHNSVNLFGVLGGSVSTDLTAAFAIVATSQTGCDVRNNIFSNQMTGGNPTAASTRHAAIFLPSAATSAMNLTLNSNAYYQGPSLVSPLSLLAQVGTTGGTGEYLASNFNPGATSPATNLRAYTSTLSVAGTNDNNSLGTAAAPPFTSATNLHIPAATPTELESKGAAVGVATDIDNDSRPGPAGSVNGGATAPDLGADEFDGVPVDVTAPSITYTALGNTVSLGSRTLSANITDIGSGVPTAGAGLPVLYWRINAGAYSAATGTYVSGSQYDFTFGSGVALGDSVSYYIVAQDGAATPNVAAAPSAGAGGLTANPPAAATPPTTPNVYYVAEITGNKTVGAGGDYTDLASAITALNNAVITRPVVFSLTDASYAVPSGGLVINANAGSSVTNTVTIRPAAGNTVAITGGATDGTVIKLNGIDYLTIDGSNNGGTSRDLTITGANAAGVVVWIASPSTSDGSTNNVVKNCVISGATGVVALADILAGSGTTLGGAAESPNSNNTIQNNLLFRAQNGCFLSGHAVSFDQNWLVVGNTFGSTVPADALTFRGAFVGSGQAFSIRDNAVIGLSSSTTSTSPVIGLQSSAANGGSITKNTVTNLRQNNTSTYGAYGINISGNNVQVSNNFVSDCNFNMSGGVAFSTTFGVFGIRVESGTGHQIYYNSVNLFGTPAGTANSALLTAAFAMVTNASTGCDVRNNIFANNISGGTTSIAHVAVYLPSGGTSTMNLTLNNNSYYNGSTVASQGVGQAGTTAGTNFYTTLAALTAYSSTLSPGGTNDNASLASTGAVPFVSSTDLHLVASPVPAEESAGAVLSVVDDIDGDSRGATPDIGADEIAGPPPVCVGDVNLDGSVGVADLLAVIAAWGPCATCPSTPCATDINGDCTIGVADLLAVIANWGTCP